MVADIKAALDQAKLVRQPEGSAVYFGVDFNLSKFAYGKVAQAGKIEPPARDNVTAVLEYFRAINQTVGNSYAVGVYGNGMVNRLLRAEKLVTYSWISASRAHDETADFYNSGQWHLFQNQVDRRWFGAPGKCTSPDVDTNVQNPKVSVSAHGARERSTRAEPGDF